MPGSRCVLLKGSRLSGAKICLFDSPPLDITTNSPHHGVTDICRKKKFPKPKYCKPLVGGGDIIAEIPFNTVLGYYPRRYLSALPDHFATPDEALTAMWGHGATVWPFPDEPGFKLNYFGECRYLRDWGWVSGFENNTQGMIMPSGSLDPAWAEDENIYFSVAFISPSIPGAPAWATLEFRGLSVPINSGPHELAAEKASFYEDDVLYEFICGPIGYNYNRFNELPSISGPEIRGWYFSDEVAFSMVLVVRRGSKDYKVCWPDSVFKKPRYAAVVDTITGFAVGPPLEIY